MEIPYKATRPAARINDQERVRVLISSRMYDLFRIPGFLSRGKGFPCPLPRVKRKILSFLPLLSRSFLCSNTLRARKYLRLSTLNILHRYLFSFLNILKYPNVCPSPFPDQFQTYYEHNNSTAGISLFSVLSALSHRVLVIRSRD